MSGNNFHATVQGDKKRHHAVYQVAYKLLGLFPHRLPTGKTEFDKFCLKVFKIYELPDVRSYREAIATMIMHLGPTCQARSLRYFGMSIRKAQANQIAYNMLMEYKELSKQEVEAEKSAPPASSMPTALELSPTTH